MREKILTQSELNLIQSKLISLDHKRFFAIAQYTGQKIKTICNLKVSDLYNKDGSLMGYINFSGDKYITHSFPIYNPLKNDLLIYAPENFIYDAWLFPSSTNYGKPIVFSTVDKWLRTAAKKAELEHLNVSTKMIRDAFICELHASGMSNAHIKKILGIVTIPEIINRTSRKPVDFRAILDNIFG